MNPPREPAIWFPTVRAGTGTDVFTERLVDALRDRGVRAEITWLPSRTEYVPLTVRALEPPAWATVAHVNSWTHPRFMPVGLPLVVTLHHSVHDPALRPYKGFVRQRYHAAWIAPIEKRVIRRATVVVAVSRFVAATARATLVDVPMCVIYNGVDTVRFHPVAGMRGGGGRFRLLYVGSWTTRKGVDLLAPIMRALDDGFELAYTGGSRAKGANMPGNTHNLVHLHGDAVVRAMQQADALLFPSRSEGLPLAAIEAMACGLPVIACAASSIPEVVEHEVTGLLAAVDDVDGLVAAIRRLAGEPGLRAAMSVNAREAACTRFAAGDMIDAYLGVYRRAMAQGPA